MADTVRRPAEGERNAALGLHAQYILAARVLLAHLPRLDWVAVADPTAGIADDFQFQVADVRHAVQVKWAQYPTTFTWSELATGSEGRASLLAGLASAFTTLTAQVNPQYLRIHLRTNENPSKSGTAQPFSECSAQPPRNFAAFIERSLKPLVSEARTDRLSSWDEITSYPEFLEWEAVWLALLSSSGLERDAFVSFIRSLYLEFGDSTNLDSSLAADRALSLDGDVRHVAWTLQSLVADPARPVRLSRTELIERLGWLERFSYRTPHSFPVPSVYSANSTASDQLSATVRGTDAGYVALVGPAGSGKSTLLTRTTWADARVAKYYAYIPDSPGPVSLRGEAETFLHDLSLMLEGFGHFRPPGHSPDLVGLRAVLQAQLEDAGEHWREASEKTVIIVDGLDHIPREQNPSRSLIDELPVELPNGVLVVIGTQTTSVLPSLIAQQLRDERVVSVPPLQRTDVGAVVRRSKAAAWLTESDIDELYEASEGHPLALRYILRDVEDIGEREDREVLLRGVLSSAAEVGAEIERRYERYLLSVAGDPEIMNLLALVARLRIPVDLGWLGSWSNPTTIDRFVVRASTYFQVLGSEWRFIHASFRRFLEAATARVGGAYDEGRNRGFHVQLADFCAASSWPRYRDQELFHRSLAGQASIIVERATAVHLRQQFLHLRPLDVVQDQAYLALSASIAVDNESAFLDLLLFLEELWQRSFNLYNIDPTPQIVATASDEVLLERLTGPSGPRVPRLTAYKAVNQLVKEQRLAVAGRLLEQLGGLENIFDGRRERDNAESLASEATEWAFAAASILGLDEVFGWIDEFQRGRESAAVPHERDAETANATHADDCVDAALAAVTDFAFEFGLEDGYLAARHRIDERPSTAWKARWRIAAARAAAAQRDGTVVATHVKELAELLTAVGDPSNPDSTEELIPLWVRAEASDLILSSGAEARRLWDIFLPPELGFPWPDEGFGRADVDALDDLLAFWTVRTAQGASSVDDAIARFRSENKPDWARLASAIGALVRIRLDVFRLQSGDVEDANLALATDEILKVREVHGSPFDSPLRRPNRDLSEHLFTRLIEVIASLDEPAWMDWLRAEFERHWATPRSRRYWPFSTRLKIVENFAKHDAGALDWAPAQLLEIEDAIAAEPVGPQDDIESWLAIASAWSAIGDVQASVSRVERAMTLSFGIGLHDDDRQLVEWFAWIKAARRDESISAEDYIQACSKNAARLPLAAPIAQEGSREAATTLVAMLWPDAPSLSSYIVEALCDSKVLSEVDAIKAIISAASADPDCDPDAVLTAYCEILLPRLRDDSGQILSALLQRTPDDLRHIASARVARASNIWCLNPQKQSLAETLRSWQAAPDQDVGTPLSRVTDLVRALSQGAEPGSGWLSSIERALATPVPVSVARQMLRLAAQGHLDLKVQARLAAELARAGAVDEAVAAVRDLVSGLPFQGWATQYDGGSRLSVWECALQADVNDLRLAAASDLAYCFSQTEGQLRLGPAGLRRIVEALFVLDRRRGDWRKIQSHVDLLFSSLPSGTRFAGHDPGDALAVGASRSFFSWLSNYLGHPSRSLDFAVRQVFGESLALPACVSDVEASLAAKIELGGWVAEAALDVIRLRSDWLPPVDGPVHRASAGAAVVSDSVLREQALEVMSRIQTALPQAPLKRLPVSYRISLPDPPETGPPELDDRGVPFVDRNNPREIVAPYDELLEAVADAVDVEPAAMLYRAAGFALENTESWLVGGHKGQAERLENRDSKHEYRPWALMVGRRATSRILSELIDARVEGVPPMPATSLGLTSNDMSRLRPEPLTSSTSSILRPAGPTYDVRGWAGNVQAAATKYADDLLGESQYVLAETSDWKALEWSFPTERRQVMPVLADKDFSQSLIVPSDSPRWPIVFGADRYRNGEGSPSRSLIVRGREAYSDSPYIEWIALNPRVAYFLGWRQHGEVPLCWRGEDGEWRARTVLHVRGLLSHSLPGAEDDVALMWRVYLSSSGLDELRAAYGRLRRRMLVGRTLPASAQEGRVEETSRAAVLIPEAANSG
jgi:hypothetical protein